MSMVFLTNRRKAGQAAAGSIGLALAWGALLAQPAVGHAQQLPPLPLVSDSLVKVIDHQEESVLEIVVGPAQLRTDGHHLRLPIQLIRLPFTGWLHGYEWEVIDPQGEPLPRDLLHHVNLIAPDQRELFFPTPRRVMAAGRETTGEKMPKLFGYPVEAGTRLLAIAMLARPIERDYPEVYVRVRLSYTREGDAFIRPRAVYPFHMDVMGAVGPKSFSIPPGGTVRSWSGSPAVDGRILAIGAHLHDNARFIRLEDETEGKVLWETEPEITADGHVKRVTIDQLWIRGGIKLRKDHRYRIVVAYDNSTEAYDPEPGMGEIGGLIMVASDAVWPKLDRNDPEYMADLKNMLEEPYRLTSNK